MAVLRRRSLKRFAVLQGNDSVRACNERGTTIFSSVLESRVALATTKANGVTSSDLGSDQIAEHTVWMKTAVGKITTASIS